MPLLDHFTPPLDKARSWRSFHTAWATNMAQGLNRGILPEHYYAEPNSQFGAVEIDVAAMKNGAGAKEPTAPPTRNWTPPGPN